MKFALATILLVTIFAEVAQAVPRTATYVYDSQGRLTQANYVNGNITTTVRYTYDPAGNRTAVSTTN